MNRHSFLKTCGLACLGGSSLAVLLESCASMTSIDAAIQGTDMLIPLSHFQQVKDGKVSFKKYIVAHNDQLQYPVCIYRLNEHTYSALLMKCSHQGAELQVFGEKLQCPAHGSEFNKLGQVESAPAAGNLRSFPVTIDTNQLKISLR